MNFLRVLDRPIAYHRTFVRLGIGLSGAVMLSQAVYWHQRTKNPDGWFYKSQEEWEDETGMTRREQETARKRLGAAGILEEVRRGVPARLFYRVNEEVLKNLIDEIEIKGDIKRQTRMSQTSILDDQERSDQIGGNGQTITEITTETTTESTSKTPVPPKGGTSAPYPEEFETLWKTYPKREGQNSKKAAYKAWKARVRSGVDPEVLYDATQRYGQYCRAKGLIGTDKVKMASTFYGPDEHYLEPWTVNHAPQPGASMHNFDGAVYEQPPLPDWTE